MIVGPSGRYVLASTEDELVRCDMRWHKTARISAGWKQFRLHAGTGAGLIVSEDGTQVNAGVVDPKSPLPLLAQARFVDGVWKFEGDNQAWATVPEYVLIGKNQLLRIADGAVPDVLGEEGEQIESSVQVVAVTGSRLIVISADSGLHVYDTVAQKAVAKLALGNEAKPSSMAISDDGEELWLDDGETLMKVSTRTWQPIDAAGSTEGGKIKFWQLDNSEGACAVLREDSRTALLINCKEMMPIAVGEFAIDVDEVVVLPNEKVLGFSRNKGTFARPKVWEKSD